MFDFSQVLQNGVPELPAAALFFVFFFGTFVSEDAACLLAGTASASGRISFSLALISCFLGIFVGDVLLYGAGRVFGSRIFSSKVVTRLVSERSRSKASVWLEKHGAAAVFSSRFITGLRLPTYLAAGALRTNFPKFVFYFLVASAIWTPILVGSTAFSQAFLFPKSAFLGLIAAALILRTAVKFSSWKNRRMFIGRLKRIAKWEFWSLPVFYLPVVVYVLLLAIKHRGLGVFTNANPAIPAGGFKGESKNEIYKGLKGSDAANGHLLRHTVIDEGADISEKILKARQFLNENALDFPVVLKPDAGERGKDVKLIDSFGELEAALTATESTSIIQEYAPGDEVSIFYYRYPNEQNGRIFSVTKKEFPVLVGDGKRTLEDLILRDPRAVCLAEKYFEQNHERLDIVPAKGAEVQLIDIGTHSRGAIFLDGDRLWTYRLERKIDEICRGFEGFYFGRFDIRTPSLTDLQQGRNFKIIELNGVTSESTNIYDPRYSLLDAYSILFEQWRIAFEIGVENRKLGEKGTNVFDLLRLAFAPARSS